MLTKRVGGLVETDEREDRHREEVLKLYFEHLKHMTTISGAGTVVILAIYQEGVVEELVLAATLVQFGLAVVIALFGMHTTLVLFRRGDAVAPTTIGCAILSPVLISGGVLTFMRIAFGIRVWPVVVINAVLFPVVVVLLYGAYRLRREREDDR